MTRPAVTLHTIAERAGVHFSLVSRVLRGDPLARLSKEKREQVIAIAAELGYRPNRVARSLRARQSRILAMLVPDITNPFHAVMFRGVEAAAQAEGYSVILCNTDDEDERFRSLVSVLSEGHVDGLLVASAKHDDQTIDWLQTQRLPFVLMNRRREQGGDPWVGPDDYRMGTLGAEHLAERGHRHLLLLIGDLSIDNMRLRARGFFERLREFGIAEGDVLVRSNLMSHEQARSAVAGLVPQIRAGEITAVFALSTIASLGAVAAFGSAGVRWPQEVSIVGYSASGAPDITSIQPPTAEIGAAAARYLIERLRAGGEANQEPAEALNIALPVRLIDCGSARAVDGMAPAATSA
ncbi:MAG TPA: LacI family DNA-binding transcriptional regulator [Burkholderiales bacterium]|nr:LacI family DNA-binding transcriptional regulator [Burkholderiales bacterium]